MVRMAKNHPLLDGNKRAAWVTLRMFIEMNEWSRSKYPTVDQAEEVVVAVAAGEWNERRMATRLRERLTPPRSTPASTEPPLR
jgi:death-on-curing protein